MTQLKGTITTPEQLAELYNNYCNINNFTPYYVLTNTEEECIVTNVPEAFYKTKNYKKYIPSDKVSDSSRELLHVLKANIDIWQPIHNDFKLNGCAYNASRLSALLTENFSIKHSLGFGFVSYSIPEGSIVCEQTLNLKKLVVHDWHAWNYVEGLLVDVSLMKNFTYNGDIMPDGYDWGVADDHIYITPPSNLEYFGIEFTDNQEFQKEVLKIVSK